MTKSIPYHHIGVSALLASATCSHYPSVSTTVTSVHPVHPAGSGQYRQSCTGQQHQPDKDTSVIDHHLGGIGTISCKYLGYVTGQPSGCVCREEWKNLPEMEQLHLGGSRHGAYQILFLSRGSDATVGDDTPNSKQK